MKNLLITGGSGTLGTALIQQLYNTYNISIISRNEANQHTIKIKYPKVQCYLCNVEDKTLIYNVYDRVRPDIVIHAAAMKHVNLAEQNPIQITKINIGGSLNIISASTHYQTPITIGISTDKACNPNSIYGYTKRIMEQCFLNANQSRMKFITCRFGNLAGSNGSVIPFWIDLEKQNKALPVTGKDMRRFMFTTAEAVSLINEGIQLCTQRDGGFILGKKMKVVQIIDLAHAISHNIIEMPPRLGEVALEYLISKDDAPYVKLLDNDYFLIDTQQHNETLPYSTNNADIMTSVEIRTLLQECQNEN